MVARKVLDHIVALTSAHTYSRVCVCDESCKSTSMFTSYQPVKEIVCSSQNVLATVSGLSEVSGEEKHFDCTVTWDGPAQST